MSRGGLVFFLFLDFSLLIVFFLLFSYYGFIFPILFLFALIMLLLLLYDLRRNILSIFMLEIMNVGPLNYKGGKESKKEESHNLFPIFLAGFVMLYSFFQLLKHGLVNPVHSFNKPGVFAEFALWLSGFGFIIFLSAVRYYNSLKDGRKEKDK